MNFLNRLKMNWENRGFQYDIKGRKIHPLHLGKMKRRCFIWRNFKISFDSNHYRLWRRKWKSTLLEGVFHHYRFLPSESWSFCVTGFPLRKRMDMSRCTQLWWVGRENGWRFRSDPGEWMKLPRKDMLLIGNTKNQQLNLPWMNGSKKSGSCWRVRKQMLWISSTTSNWIYSVMKFSFSPKRRYENASFQCYRAWFRFWNS